MRDVPAAEARLVEVATEVRCTDEGCGADVGEQCVVNPSEDRGLRIERREGVSLKRCLIALLRRIEELPR